MQFIVNSNIVTYPLDIQLNRLYLLFQTYQDLLQRQQVETEEIQNELDQTEIQQIEKLNNVSLPSEPRCLEH